MNKKEIKERINKLSIELKEGIKSSEEIAKNFDDNPYVQIGALTEHIDIMSRKLDIWAKFL